MRMPSFARRHPWVGLLIVVTIGVASWMLLRAPPDGRTRSQRSTATAVTIQNAIASPRLPSELEGTENTLG